MDVSQMDNRCNDHRFHSIAVLHNFKFMINGRGKATLVPSQVDDVWGVLWALSHDDIIELDRWEGVPGEYYHRKACKVVIQDESKISAWIYFASDTTKGSPSIEYSNKILKGATENGLPESYVAALNYILGCV